MRRFKEIGLLSLLSLAMISCSAPPTPAQMFSGQSAAQIYQGGEVALAKKEYSNAIQHFEALDTLYPFGTHSEQALLSSVYAYYKSDDMASAAAAADRFIRLYPRSSRVDYAYYMKGLANYEQDRGWFLRYLPTDTAARDPGTARQAFNDFNELIRRFPNSPYAADARQRMIHLRNIFADFELHVARYYMKREAYVAALNRASNVVEHYQHTPAVAEALSIMVTANRKLGLTAPANEALQVLKLNFPHSKFLNELENEKG